MIKSSITSGRMLFQMSFCGSVPHQKRLFSEPTLESLFDQETTTSNPSINKMAAQVCYMFRQRNFIVIASCWWSVHEAHFVLARWSPRFTRCGNGKERLDWWGRNQRAQRGRRARLSRGNDRSETVNTSKFVSMQVFDTDSPIATHFAGGFVARIASWRHLAASRRWRWHDVGHVCCDAATRKTFLGVRTQDANLADHLEKYQIDLKALMLAQRERKGTDARSRRKNPTTQKVQGKEPHSAEKNAHAQQMSA